MWLQIVWFTMLRQIIELYIFQYQDVYAITASSVTDNNYLMLHTFQLVLRLCRRGDLIAIMEEVF